MRRETVNVKQEWLNRINITTAFERYQTNLFAWNEKGGALFGKCNGCQ